MTLSKASMTTKQLDTWENLKCIMLYGNTTGGLAFELSQRIMFKDVASANNSRSIEARPNLRLCLLKGRNQLDLSLTVLWT